MNQFVFEQGQKRLFQGLMILGIVCMALTFLGDDAYHSRFWSNFLHNSVFFTGISFVTLFMLSAFVTAFAGWYVVVKRLWEAYTLFLVVGLILMGVVILGIWGHFHHLYHWTDAEAVAGDPVLSGKAGFLNKGWYTFGTLIIMGVWYFLFARPMRKISVDEDTNGTMEFSHYKRIQVYSAAFLPVGAFSSAALIWLWVMSVDAHWYSTLFAWYATASWFVSAMSLSIILVYYLKSKGYFTRITNNHLHDMGKYMFAFSVFWTYLWFSQYMLIWYGNVGEETVYFQERLNNYGVLFYGNLIINFLLPFFVLMRNDTKRKAGTMIFASIFVFFGHWLDFFLMIKPGVRLTTEEALAHHGHDAAHAAEGAAHGSGDHIVGFLSGFTIPGLLEIGTMLGFLGLFLYFVFSRLTKASLVPYRDPYIQESIHHETLYEEYEN